MTDHQKLFEEVRSPRRGRLKPDLLSPERMARQLMRIEALTGEVGVLWAEACAAGSQAGSSGFGGGRGSGFEDIDPTSSAALSLTQRQLRAKARRASVLVNQAVQQLEESAGVLTDGFLLTDDQVLGRFIEKRQAAMGESVRPPE